MLVTKRSGLTGVEHTVEVPVTQEQLDHWYASGQHIQVALPHLGVNDREFLMTGTTAEEWDHLVPPDEDVEDYE